MSMKYLVIQGRAPQDGSAARTALILCPSWMSSTLVCAGIVGRVIELTDGNIIEECVLPHEGGEEELLDEIRNDLYGEGAAHPATNPFSAPEPTAEVTEADTAAVQQSAVDSQLETTPVEYSTEQHPIAANHVSLDTAPSPLQTPTDAAQQRDDAYREGSQAARNMFTETLKEHGFNPAERGMKEWLVAELEELAQFRKDRPETLAALQKAHDNLDAWRDAAGAAYLVQECDADGQIKRLLLPNETGVADIAPELLDSYQAVQEDLAALVQVMDEYREPARGAVRWLNPEWLRSQLSKLGHLQMLNEQWDDMGRLLGEFGITNSQNRLEWLRHELDELETLRKGNNHPDTAQLIATLHGEVAELKRDREAQRKFINEQHDLKKKIRKLLK